MAVGNKIKLGDFSTLLGSTDEIIDVPVSELHTFKNHPFKLIDDEKMAELIESIRINGVLTPAIVRADPNGGYELISGHRRKYACVCIGKKEMPVIVKELNDDEATILMVDSNIQREEILPSERAFAYKMKLEAMSRKRGRPKNDAQVVQNKGRTSVEIIAAEVGESRANIQRYIRLTFLSKELLERVDEKQLPLNVAVELSYLTPTQQKDVNNAIDINNAIFSLNAVPTIAQAKELRAAAEKDKNALVGNMLLTNTNHTRKSVSFSFNPEIKNYFPANYSKKQIEEKIMYLLEKYQEELQEEE